MSAPVYRKYGSRDMHFVVSSGRPSPALFMNAPAAIVDSRLRQADRRACSLVSRRDFTNSRQTVMNNAGH